MKKAVAILMQTKKIRLEIGKESNENGSEEVKYYVNVEE